MKHLFCSAALLLSMNLFAGTPARTILLYPNGAPDSNGYTAADEYVKNETKIYQIAEPRLDIYRPDIAPKGIILSIPGGGYSFVSSGNEGIKVADFFVPRGYIVAVLKYRLPNGHENIPLHDALQAMHILRDSAAVWHPTTVSSSIPSSPWTPRSPTVVHAANSSVTTRPMNSASTGRATSKLHLLRLPVLSSDVRMILPFP